MIPPVYASTDLKTSFREVKDAASDTLTVITENGRGRYVFSSAAAYANDISSAAWEEANEERLAMGIEQGRADFARGAFVVGTDAAIALSEKMRLARG